MKFKKLFRDISDGTRVHQNYKDIIKNRPNKDKFDAHQILINNLIDCDDLRYFQEVIDYSKYSIYVTLPPQMRFFAKGNMIFKVVDKYTLEKIKPAHEWFRKKEIYWSMNIKTKDIMITKQAVNLRAGPSTDYVKLEEVQWETEVKIIARGDTWYLVEINPWRGFINKNYLKIKN